LYQKLPLKAAWFSKQPLSGQLRTDMEKMPADRTMVRPRKMCFSKETLDQCLTLNGFFSSASSRATPITYLLHRSTKHRHRKHRFCQA
jgi:hypothetical protein